MSSGPFLRVLQELVPEATIARGLSYFRQGRVERVRLTSEGVLEAVVRGTLRYEVSLGLNEGGFWTDCACPAWRRASSCKHAVAVAILADEEEVSHAMTEALLAGDSAAAASRGLRSTGLEAEPGEMRAAPSWRARFSKLQLGARRRREEAPARDPGKAALFELWVDPDECRDQNGLVLALTRRPSLKKGDFGEAKAANWSSLHTYQSISPGVLSVLERVMRLASVESMPRSWRPHSELFVPPDESARALEALAGTVDVRCVMEEDSWTDPLRWSPEPWRFGLVLTSSEEEGVPVVRLEGELTRGGVTRSLSRPRLLLRDGIVLFHDVASPLADADAFDWISTLREDGSITVRGPEIGAFLDQLLEVSTGVPLELGDVAAATAAPVGTLDLALVPGQSGPERYAQAQVSFEYGGTHISAANPTRHMIERGGEVRILRRNDEAEAELLEALMDEGCERSGPEWVARPYRMPIDGLSERCGRLIEAGWQVQIENKALRTGGSLSMRVDSGIDWFDVKGEATFDKSALPLPRILKAVLEGRGFVQLDDGGAALLPPEWTGRLEALGALTATAAAVEGEGEGEESVLISRARAPLLDLLLREFSQVETDEAFKKQRLALRNFKGVAPRRETRSFRGELRPYQREALGWFAFLRKAGLGGCLADDMGLGKTIQVLACLLPRRRAKDRRGPSLVVAPRSVLSNWIREAARFAPGMRTATYHGPKRARVLADLSGLDLIVTTYGTMMRDATRLSEIEFDYVVLDESQAIKNASSKTARAARLLNAHHRLALSGTPIENHLEELGSLFAFLNPGLLGNKREFQTLLGSTSTPSGERLAWLQAALRPVILRRTREQVLTELPDLEEQILRCVLPDHQRKAYDGIREHYRASVLSRVEESGLARSKMHVLEALLRLRQAACHPALIDPSRSGDASAKIDQLIPMLEEISDTGHKALVFSQFTSFLAIVRNRLDNLGIRYEYMDGKTRRRGEVVDNFQQNPDSAVFLISLKAGGTGLNLTAAQYVFLLDPWWNPAVEAQAIGRAHRMGQRNPVTVYRLIGEDTVEDRVLELQARKRDLVQAVLGGVSDAPLRSMTRDDLELLLG